MDAAANDALVRAFLGTWERRDTDAIVDALAEDAVYQAIGLPPIEGRAALRTWVESRASSPPPRIDVLHQVANDRIVMNERTDHVVLNGRGVTLRICAVFEIDDAGRIRAWREYLDLGPAKAAYD